jgi:hypothetical protein
VVHEPGSPAKPSLAHCTASRDSLPSLSPELRRQRRSVIGLGTQRGGCVMMVQLRQLAVGVVGGAWCGYVSLELERCSAYGH